MTAPASTDNTQTVAGPCPDVLIHITPKGSDLAFCGRDMSGVASQGKAISREQQRDDCAVCWQMWRDAGKP